MKLFYLMEIKCDWNYADNNFCALKHKDGSNEV